MQFHFPLDRSWSMGSYIQENSLLKEEKKKKQRYFLTFYTQVLTSKKKKSFSNLFKVSPKLVIYRLGEQRVTTAVWQVKEWAVGSGGKGAEQLLLPAWCSCLLQEGFSLPQVLQLAQQCACWQSTECSLISFSCFCSCLG